MYCRYCGKKIADNALFCTNCGKKIPEADIARRETVKFAHEKPAEEQVKETAPETNAQPQQPKQERRGLKPWAIVLIAVGGVLMLILMISLITWSVGNTDYEEPIYEYDDTLTDEVEQGDEAVSLIFTQTDYISADDAGKAEIVGEKLEELCASGDIYQLSYDSQCNMYTYRNADGTWGGVSLAERSEDINGGIRDIGSTVAQLSPVSKRDGSPVDVLVLNGFEDEPRRTDYYNELESEWRALGINIVVDHDVSHYDMASIYGYDVVIFSMHGSHYEGMTALCIDDMSAADDYNYNELLSNGSTAKVYNKDGAPEHYVFPKFFIDNYSEGDFDGTVVFSESCMFFGCDCTSLAIDRSYSEVFLGISAETVIGYHNSVGMYYSRNVMKHTLEAMFNGRTALEGLADAQAVYGSDDDYYNLYYHKYISYPVLEGDQNAVIASNVKATGYDGLWGAGNYDCGICGEDIYDILLNMEIIDESTVRFDLECNGYIFNDVVANIGADGYGVIDASASGIGLSGNILLEEGGVYLTIDSVGVSDIQTGSFKMNRVYADMCQGHENENGLADGEYRLIVKEGTFRDTVDGIAAYADVLNYIIMTDETVNSLQVGSVIDLEPFGLNNIEVEYLQRQSDYGNELIFISDAPYYLIKPQGETIWYISGVNDMKLSCVSGQMEVVFSNSCTVIDSHSYIASGQGAPDQIMSDIRELYNQPMVSDDDLINVRVSGGKIVEARMYYST